MAFTEIELKRFERDIAKFMEIRRPPPHIRPQLDIGARLSGQSIEIFEIRPDWQDKTTLRETPVAKATYVRATKHWRIFWMRRDLKWHGYEPHLKVSTLGAVLKVVDEDEYCCFFG